MAETVRDLDREVQHSLAVREMFSGIAGRYDFLNHFLSLNIDKSWRRKVLAELGEILEREDARVIDVACGTGDLALALKSRAKSEIFGTDFCRPMLELAKRKSEAEAAKIRLIEADAMQLPLADNSFDGVTIGFGLRNLPNIEHGLMELHRILKPGGTLVVLEFSAPSVPGFRQAFNLYFRRILPMIGGIVSGSRAAYTYLPGSVAKFLDQKGLAELMKKIGFTEVKYTNLTGGIVAIHKGRKT